MPELTYNQKYYRANRVAILKKRKERYNEEHNITNPKPYEPPPAREQKPKLDKEPKKKKDKKDYTPYYAIHRDRLLAKQKERYKTDEEFRERIKARSKITMKERGKDYEPETSYNMTDENRTKIKKKIKKRRVILPNPPSQEYLDWLWTDDTENEPEQGKIANKWVNA